MNSQLKKGVLEICILKLLEKQDCYGYEIICGLQADFPGTEESTLYAILRRMNREAYTEVYHRESTSGPGRKYYRITDHGRQYLEAQTADLHALYDIAKKYELFEPKN